MGLCLLMLAGVCLFGNPGSARAEAREDILLYNGAEANEDDEYVSESELYQVGDTGLIRTSYVYGELARVEFSSSNTSVVQVDGVGARDSYAGDYYSGYRIVGGGKAIVTVLGYDNDGGLAFQAGYCFRCCADVSGAALQKTAVTTYIINWSAKEVEVAFNNMPDLAYYTFSYTSSNSRMNVECALDPAKKTLNIYSGSKGTTTLTIVVNNTEFTLTVKTSEVTMNKISAVLAKTKKTTVKIRGYSGSVKWRTTKKSVATVSAKGVVKAKKTGNAVVYVEIEGQRLGCAVSVVTAKLQKVVTAAKKIATGTYSQPRRMQKGYYDCSSLVWRSYKKIGKTFGDRHYAPVAANIAKYLFGKNKRIKGGLNSKNIQGMKLRPGDLMFETGAKNGRYKGIYHVEMFVGYQCEGFDSKGKPILGTLWAARPANAYYGHPMGRP